MTSKIYKIHSTRGEKVYIGSTTMNHLSRRKAGHLSRYRHDNKRHCSSHELFNDYGVENCQWVLLEECPLDQRFIRERWWIENTPHTINIRRPFITYDELAQVRHPKMILCDQCGHSMLQTNIGRHKKTHHPVE